MGKKAPLKKRQFTMERPEPLCTTLLFLFAFQVEYFFPNFSLFFFILSVRRSVSSAYVPRNATQLAMCLGSLCTESKDLWSAENFISVSNPKWRTKHVACSLDKICQERGTYAALSLHGNVLWFLSNCRIPRHSVPPLFSLVGLL